MPWPLPPALAALFFARMGARASNVSPVSSTSLAITVRVSSLSARNLHSVVAIPGWIPSLTKLAPYLEFLLQTLMSQNMASPKLGLWRGKGRGDRVEGSEGGGDGGQ